jgi:hypothetical protein
MTRTATTKLVATALAVASLGLTATAQAAPGDVVDPAVPATPDTAAQTQANKTQAPLGETPAQGANAAAAQGEEDIDYNSPEYFKSDEAKKRFERYCNMKDAEPSHSDKKFCEDFRKNNGTTTTTTSGHGRPDYCKYQNVRYDPRCDEWYPKPHPKPTYPGHKPTYEKTHYSKTEPSYYKKASEPSKGSLPFTGLEIWQLGLIGIVLVGGGIGARRLLAS